MQICLWISEESGKYTFPSTPSARLKQGKSLMLLSQPAIKNPALTRQNISRRNRALSVKIFGGWRGVSGKAIIGGPIQVLTCKQHKPSLPRSSRRGIDGYWGAWGSTGESKGQAWKTDRHGEGNSLQPGPQSSHPQSPQDEKLCHFTILPGGPNGHCGPLSILDRCHVPSLKLLEDTGISSLLCLCHILSRFKAEGYRPHSHLTPKKAHSLRTPPKMGGWLQKLSRQKMANVFYKWLFPVF